jgi:(p)ppGpp synthase/HD superfamily hydrolase
MVIKNPPSQEESNIEQYRLPPSTDVRIERYVRDLLELLDEWGLSQNTQIATRLLHHLASPALDTDAIRHKFGERPLELLLRAKNILYPPKSKSATERSIRAEHLRRCYYLAYTDHEALLFILAMRLVSLGDIDHLSTDERMMWAKQNLSHYLPIFELLGLHNYAQALRDISLRLTNKDLYQQLEGQIETYYQTHHHLFLQFQQRINELLESSPIPDVRIKPQELSPADLYTFYHDKDTPPNTPKLPNHLMVDMLLDHETDCYALLGILHQQFTPIKPVTDYLANPRLNGHRALISTLQVNNKALVTVHIRTHEAEKVNTHGILEAKRIGKPIKNVWWDNPHHSIAHKPSDKEAIGVFAPDGRWIYPIQQGFTVLDFAFRIHSELGAYARHFWINGKPAVHHHTLHHTDLIEVDFDRHTPHINTTWLESAYSPKTRRYIKTFLKRHSPTTQAVTDFSTGAERIETVLEREMAVYGLRFSAEQIETKLQKWAASNQYADVHAVYQAIELGHITADEVVCALIEEEFIPHIARADGKRVNHARVRLCRCWMMAEENIKWTLASRITIDTPIVGRMIGKDKPFMMVHRADCLNAPTPDEAIKLRWQKPMTNSQSAEFIIHAPFRFGISSVILHKFETHQKHNHENMVLHRFHTETNAYQMTITCTITAPNMGVIHELQNELNILQERGDIFDYSVWGLFHSEHLRLSGKLDKRQHNPYTLKQIRDQAMFFGRDEEIKRIIEYLREGETFIVLYGQKRIGKTSLMEHLGEHLIPKTLPNDILPIFFDALSLAPFNTQTLLRGLIESAIPHIIRAIKRATLPTDLRLRLNELYQSPFTYFAQWVKQVEKRLGGKRLLFMIDEFTRAEEEYKRGQIDESFFSGLQWLAGNQHIGFFICVHDHIYRQNTQSWGFLQRGHPLYLRTLDKQAAKKLIQLPLQSLYQFDDGIVDKIVALTNGHPYFIQAICLELSVHMSKQDTHRITDDDLSVAINRVLHNGRHYFHHFHNQETPLCNDVLKCIAFLADDEHQWVERETIQEAALEWQIGNRMSIAESIGILYQAGIIEARTHNNTKSTYRIPIKLFQFWLRQGTHPLIRSDMQKHEGLSS